MKKSESNVVHSRYEQRGVSSDKKEVHDAIKHLSKGLFPKAFCKVVPSDHPDYCMISHADGVGTKTALAYAYWRTTADLGVWKDVAIDAIVMNLDDMLCAGVTTEPMCYSSTIGINGPKVRDEVIRAIIEGNEEFINKLNSLGLNIHYAGGETAKIGDLVRTVVIDGTMTVRLKRSNVMVPAIREDDVIVGLASFGLPSMYEDQYNSGIGSNGLTSARHDLFNEMLRLQYPETFDPCGEQSLVYCGSHEILDWFMIEETKKSVPFGKFVLSPTRTYAPIVIDLLKHFDRKNVHAMIHCSGGGQTKVMNFLPKDVSVLKDNLFAVPQLFAMIQRESSTKWYEMYKTFNMGHRFEIYCAPDFANTIIQTSLKFGVNAQIIGTCHKRQGNEHPLTIISPDGEKLHYKK